MSDEQRAQWEAEAEDEARAAAEQGEAESELASQNTCPKCGDWKISFVRFMTFNGQLSREVEVSVHKCDQCGNKFVTHRRTG